MKSLQSIAMETRHDGFALVRTEESGDRSELRLSEADIVFLPRVLQETLEIIRAKRVSLKAAEQGVACITAVRVSAAGVNLDIFRSLILLTLRDEFGNSSGFALSSDVALPLAVELTERARDVHEANEKRTFET